MTMPFAPTGRDSRAQANGLGTRPHHIVSPNGARFVHRVARAIASFHESRPVGASAFIAAVTQAYGLGYRMPPRWGQERNARLAT